MMKIQGQVLFDHGLVAAWVALRVYHRGFGGFATSLGQVTTDGTGKYSFTIERSAQTNVEVRAVSTAGTEVSLTETLFNIGDDEVLNLVVPAEVQPLIREYQRLNADVIKHVDGRKLGEARERDEQRDITLLNRATRWDARLVALAASANRLADETDIEIDGQALYGMFRAGLPSQPLQLAMVSTAAVGEALRKANEAGVVFLRPEEISQVQVQFDKFARNTRRVLVAPGTASSYGDLLDITVLNENQRRQFDKILTEHRGSAKELWEKADKVDLPVEQLKLTARLGYLTLNNAGVIKNLQNEIDGSENLAGVLVGRGFYQPTAWESWLDGIAGSDESLAELIPPAYLGETTEERLAAYAADLARKVRVSYPTQVVTQMVLDDQLQVGAMEAEVKEDVATVLQRAMVYDFSLGGTPFKRFVNKHPEQLFGGMTPQRAAAASEGIKTLQRLYQITPSDEALKALLDNEFTSAHDVTAMSYEKFMRRYADKFPSLRQAELTYRRAQQVSTVVYTFFGAVKQLDSAPPVHVLSPPASVVEAAKNNVSEHFPTMKSLFGSLDYCECDHCRSVLSPAAYLVDLLKFLDPDPLVWNGDMAEWKSTHGGAQYPFPDKAAWEAFQQEWKATHDDAEPPAPLTPYEVLTERADAPPDFALPRRPDLPHLPLTCENTHTAMPYIDIVNEILEYYLVHKKLEPKAVHDTGNALSADLLAEPQHVLAKAYDEILNKARYPLTLPFELWLETVRRFCEHFDTPLWRLLDALRLTDELYPPAGVSYGRAAVFTERLGVSAAEHAVFTASDTMATWHDLYGYQTAEQAAELASAKVLARRLGVSYRQLVELVRSGFVNPRLETLVTLRKLGVDTEDVLRYYAQPGYPSFSKAERAAFETKLRADGLAWLQQAWDRGDFEQILVLADPNAGCSFENTTLQYADDDPADPIAFVTLNYLVRLWRRLGWSIADTDRAVQVFLPRDPPPRTIANIGPAMATVLLGIAHLETLNELLKVGKKGRTRLLYLWSDLDDARYAELFLTGSVQTRDPVFDHPLGQYLSYLAGGKYRPFRWDGEVEDLDSGNVPLHGHVGAVQAALQLTTDEVTQILADAGTSLADTDSDPGAPLDLPTVSLLYRYGLLAKLLKLGMADLIVLKGLSGLDPFKPLHDGPVTILQEDHPYGQTQRFVEVAAAVKDSGLSIADLNYLLRHRFDPVGPHRAAVEPPLALVRALAAEIARIRAEHAVPADPLTFTDEVLRQKLALILPTEVVETFHRMWTGTIEYQASEEWNKEEKVESDPWPPAPAVRLYYDTVLEQVLVHRGVLVEQELERLLDNDSIADLFGGLLRAVHRQAKDFFVQHLQRSQDDQVSGGFLEPADFDPVFIPFTPEPPGPNVPPVPQQREQHDKARRDRFARALLPYVQDRLTRALIVETVAGNFGADPALAEALLTNPALLDDPDVADRPLLDAYAAAGERGVTRTPGSDSVRLDGYLEVPATGAYRFFVRCARSGTTVELRFDHLADPLVRGTATSNHKEFDDHTELRAGVAYGFTLDAHKLGEDPPADAVTLLIHGEQLPKSPIETLTVYPRDGVAAIHRAHLLLAKTLRLVTALELTEREVRHLLTHPDDFDGLDLGELPTRAVDDTPSDTPSQATKLFGQFLRLVGYTRLRRDIAAEPDDLIELFAHARRSYPPGHDVDEASEAVLDDLCDRMARLTRRDPATVRAGADLLEMSADAPPDGPLVAVTAAGFAQERGVRRLWELLALAGKLGAAPDTLRRWATPTPDYPVAQELRDSVKARYEPERWRRVAQPIFDKLRQRRRDALVAHIMHTRGFASLEKLYEHFLIDPGTEPVVQTSRLRLAISSVQLFIQRCLLNLEPDVHPSVINSAHWQWMKRYRVWEANRKIFLFPENWLEPEFRDDKTHLFVELESALLQSDLSNDHAEAAFFGYLRQLEELARLDVRAIYLEEKPDAASNVLHVVARTFGSPHKYFYRSYAHQMWTPWVPVTADIEGDHLVVVVWRGRVHLFWVTFLEKGGKQVNAKKTPNEMLDTKLGQIQPPRWVEVQLSWSEYFQDEWTNPVSSGFHLWGRPKIHIGGPPVFHPGAVFIHATVEDDDSLCIHLTDCPDYLDFALRLVSKNSPPTVRSDSLPPWPPFTGLERDGRGRYVSEDDGLTVRYIVEETTQGGQTTCDIGTKDVLGSGEDYTLVTHGDTFKKLPVYVGYLVRPFFYSDGQHTFYVEPTLTETTTIDEGDAIVLGTPPVNWAMDDVAKKTKIGQQVPAHPELPDISPVAKFVVKDLADWVTTPTTVVPFDDDLIGPTGGVTPRGVSTEGN